MRSERLFIPFLTILVFFQQVNAQIAKSGTPVLRAEYFPSQADEAVKDNPFFDSEKAPGSTIYSTGFSNSLGSWTTTGPDGNLWQHDDDGPNGQFAVTENEVISSQSVNNGFVIFDADVSNPGGGPWSDRIGQLVSPVIDMTEISYSFIEFWHKYRFCCDNNFIPRVEVTTNGFLTFASFDATIPGLKPNTISPTYKAKINISAFLDTASNLNNFQLRFNFDGSNGGSHYYWQIDDVKVRESFQYDLFNVSTSFALGEMGLPYYFISQSQLSPITFSATLRNDGSMPASAVKLSVSSDPLIGGGTGPVTAISSAIELAASATATLITEPTMMFTDTNFYTMTYDLLQDSLDAIPQDNKLNHLITLHRRLYSIDDNQPTGYIANMSGQSGQAMKIGNVMEIMNDDLIDSMYVFVTATSTNVGQFICGEIRKRENGSWVLIGTTGLKAITQQNNGGSIGMSFPAPLAVSSGDTLLVLACHSGGAPDVRFRITQKVEEGLVQGYLSDGSPFILSDPNAIMIRLGMNELVGLDEERNESKLIVYPNPSTDVLFISDNPAFDEFAVYELSSLDGKLVSSGILDSKNGIYELKTSHLNRGIYFIDIKGSRSLRTSFIKM